VSKSEFAGVNIDIPSMPRIISEHVRSGTFWMSLHDMMKNFLASSSLQLNNALGRTIALYNLRPVNG